jgi:hypothetical protein
MHAQAEPEEQDSIPPAVQDQISEGVLEGQQLAARIEAAALRGVDIEVQMFAIDALATHLAVTRSDRISEARSKVDAIPGTAVNSIASTFAAKQYGMTRQ